MKKFYSLALASGLLVLGGCSSEEPLGYDPTPIDEDGNIGYVRLDLPGLTQTRAFSEMDATEDEAQIEEAAFVFYYGSKTNPSFFTRYARKTPQPGDLATWTTDHEGKTCAIIKLPRMVFGVAVICNGERGDKYQGDLNELDEPVYKYAKGDDKLFYMSSGRYYDADKVYTQMTPITAEMLFKTKEEAEAGVDANGNLQAAQINVEHYVAKVNIKNKFSDKYKLDGDGNIDVQANLAADKKVMNATVKFKPMYTFLTAFSTSTTAIKKLPVWNNIPTDAKSWADVNNLDARYSSWLIKGNYGVKWPLLKELNSNTKLLGSKSNAYPVTGANLTYAFDNNAELEGKKTSVVVAGRYTVTDDKGVSLADPTDGTFYLVAFTDKFAIYKTEKEAILAMGGAEGDKLVPDEVVDDNLSAASPVLPGVTDDKWANWTGWMRLYNRDNVVRCLKYDKGYGYYSMPINHYKSYDMVVRNHLYDCTITGIGGFGIGIPDENTPIIPINPPKPEDQTYYLHMGVKVLPWRTVDNTMNWE